MVPEQDGKEGTGTDPGADGSPGAGANAGPDAGGPEAQAAQPQPSGPDHKQVKSRPKFVDKKGGKQTPAQKAATLRNLQKAQDAQKGFIKRSVKKRPIEEIAEEYLSRALSETLHEVKVDGDPKLKWEVAKYMLDRKFGSMISADKIAKDAEAAKNILYVPEKMTEEAWKEAYQIPVEKA